MRHIARPNLRKNRLAIERRMAVRSNCESGKMGHANRRAALAEAKAVRGRGEHVRPYQCPECERWHVGHLPLVVMQGQTTADEFYGRTTSAVKSGGCYICGDPADHGDMPHGTATGDGRTRNDVPRRAPLRLTTLEETR